MQRPLLAIAALLLAAGVDVTAQAVTQPELRAAFLYNFAKFTEWPGDPVPTSPLTLCVIDDSAVEDALGNLVGAGTINGRPATVSRDPGGAALRACHVLYLGEGTGGRTAAILDSLQGASVLTVSTGDGFIRSGGMVGLFVEDGRMRFAINPDAAQRAGVRLSSWLLQLAKIGKGAR
jgi:hypothetical protein